MTELEKFLIQQIRKALKVKGNPVRTAGYLMEAMQNIPTPKVFEEKPSKSQTLDEAFGIAAPQKEPEKPARTPLKEYLKTHPDVTGKTVFSINQPGAVYSISGEDESVKGVRLFTLTVLKSNKKGGEGQLFHNVPEDMLVMAF